MINQIYLYTYVNYSDINTPIEMSVFIDTGDNIVPIDTIVPEFTANFNDYTSSSYVCTYDDFRFSYTYNTPIDLANIQISATISDTICSAEFNVIRIDSEIKNTDLDVKRISPSSLVSLPHNMVYVPSNEWGVAEAYNKVIDGLYDNFEYLIDLCKTYSSSPTRYIGWGEFKTYIPNTEFTSQFVQSSSTFYGVLGNTDKVVILYDLPSGSYIPGTSLINVVSTIDCSEIPEVDLIDNNLIYCSNIDNKGVHLLSANYDLSQFSDTNSLSSFTHTTIAYDLLDENGDIIDPELSQYIVISTTDGSRHIIKSYTLPDVLLPVNSSYTPKTISWHLDNQFNSNPVISGSEIFDPINDIVIDNNILYVARKSFVEKYDVSTAFIEMKYTTEFIDISEIYTNSKSIGISQDKRLYMLDNIRHLIYIYQENPTTNLIECIGRWGTLGGPTDKQGFYKPNQIIVHNDRVYVCDSGNKVIKQFSLQGNWMRTYDFSSELPSDASILGMCIDYNNNIHVLTDQGIIKIIVTLTKNIIKFTSIDFNSSPIKIVTNYDGKMLYVCCKKQVYVISLDNEVVSSFAEIDPYSYVDTNEYVSITTDKTGTIYLTDGKYIFKYLDIPDVLEIRNNTVDSCFWSREQIYIDPTEFVSEWVYNRSMRRMAENVDILFRSMENKIIPIGRNKFKLEPYNEGDVGFLQGLPITLDNFCAIGINEFVTSEVLNRCIDKIQQNIFYILCLILNCFTSNPNGLEVNFIVMPPVIPECCWSWWARQEGRCCTPWYWLTTTTTWVHAENRNNAVVLSGGWFAISGENASKLNTVGPDFTLSFWLSTISFNPDNSFNLIGLSNTSLTNPGMAIGVSGGELVANLNGLYFPTTGNIMDNNLGKNMHVVFNKRSIDGDYTNSKCEFYIDNVKNTSYNDVPGLIFNSPILDNNSLTYSYDDFMFGSPGLSPNDSFSGILHDVWLFKIPIDESDLIETMVQTLSSRPAYWQIPNSWRRLARAHWYCNSKYAWVDDVANNNAIVTGGDKEVLQDFYGTCCEE